MNDQAVADFSKLQHLLESAGADSAAAEAHGEFCGRACLTGVAAIRAWQKGTLDDADDDSAQNVLLHECNSALETLAADSLLKLEAGDMRFEVLLPDDDEPLQMRALALADWCHGFMQGLVVAGGADQGPKADTLEATTVSEILDDFSEITKAGAVADEGEAAENAYAEVVEYVRVSAQLIYEETAALRAGSQEAAQEH